MNKAMLLVIGLSVGFGTGYLAFNKEEEKVLTLTLSGVDSMQPDQVREILLNKGCVKITYQTIQCSTIIEKQNSLSELIRSRQLVGEWSYEE